mmetsp:Transcript_23383/g.53638  ORF Transcript_23383/g.53638 Transcript_23383/m.53638 type:complete len:297 (+) Transcript_23383:364-1254(+)
MSRRWSSGAAWQTSKTRPRHPRARRDDESRDRGKSGGEEGAGSAPAGPASRLSSDAASLAPLSRSSPGPHALPARCARICTTLSSSGSVDGDPPPSPGPSRGASRSPSAMPARRSRTADSNDRRSRPNDPAVLSISREELTDRSSRSGADDPDPEAAAAAAPDESVPAAMASSDACPEMRASTADRVAGALYPPQSSSNRSTAASASGNILGARPAILSAAPSIPDTPLTSRAARLDALPSGSRSASARSLWYGAKGEATRSNASRTDARSSDADAPSPADASLPPEGAEPRSMLS